MRIDGSARKHEVPDKDILHTVRNAILQFTDDELSLLIGPAINAALLEIGVLDLEGDDPVVIHAMPARPKFLR